MYDGIEKNTSLPAAGYKHTGDRLKRGTQTKSLDNTGNSKWCGN